jgi:hypothetical protein
VTDILLDAADGTFVTVDARVLKAMASDFILDYPSYHSNRHVPRRALVHNQQDGLTINYNRDYPGGVTINDVVSLTNRNQGMALIGVNEISASAGAWASEIGDLGPHGGSGGTGSTGANANATLTLRGHILFEATPGSATSKPVPLQDTILQLQRQIDTLTKRLTVLEGIAGRTAQSVAKQNHPPARPSPRQAPRNSNQGSALD